MTNVPAMSASPIFRWAGGKGRVLDQIAPHLPSSFARYFEPFAGGPAMFFHLGHRATKASLNDKNKDLMSAYRTIRDTPNAVHEELLDLWAYADRFNNFGDAYEFVRADWNHNREGASDARRAAAFLFLNRTCFNGLWRENRQGFMNVPVGRFGESGPRRTSLAELQAASTALRNASISSLDFRDILSGFGPDDGDLVYIDSPYAPISPTSFTGYTADGFNEQDHRDLATCAIRAASHGARVAVSNSNTPLIREIYRGHRAIPIGARRSVSAAGGARRVERELLICLWPRVEQDVACKEEIVL